MIGYPALNIDYPIPELDEKVKIISAFVLTEGKSRWASQRQLGRLLLCQRLKGIARNVLVRRFGVRSGRAYQQGEQRQDVRCENGPIEHCRRTASVQRLTVHTTRRKISTRLRANPLLQCTIIDLVSAGRNSAAKKSTTFGAVREKNAFQLRSTTAKRHGPRGS